MCRERVLNEINVLFRGLLRLLGRCIEFFSEVTKLRRESGPVEGGGGGVVVKIENYNIFWITNAVNRTASAAAATTAKTKDERQRAGTNVFVDERFLFLRYNVIFFLYLFQTGNKNQLVL